MYALRLKSSRTNLLKVSLMALAAVLAALVLALVVKVEPSQAAFPGENGKLVFSTNMQVGEGVDNPDGDYEIFTINPDGTDLTQLTRNATDDFSPEWTPEGTKIAYSWNYEGGEGYSRLQVIILAIGQEYTTLTKIPRCGLSRVQSGRPMARGSPLWGTAHTTTPSYKRSTWCPQPGGRR